MCVPYAVNETAHAAAVVPLDAIDASVYVKAILPFQEPPSN
jgi:hypothetical protein